MRPKAQKGAGGFYARRDAMVDAAIFDDRLSRASIRVFSAIKRHWRPDNLTAFPGRGTIAEIAKCDNRTVTRAIAELREHGYIIVTRGGRKGDRYTMPDTIGNSDENVVISETVNSDKSVGISEGNSDIPEPKFRQNDAAPYREAEDETEGAKTPTASSAPDHVSLCQSSISEGGGFDADDRVDPPFDEPTEDDKPIIDPPYDPRPIPEIPASLEEEWRRADEQAEPPEPRETDDDPEALAEIENLTFGNVDPVEFITEWERGFIACDAESTEKVLAIVARAARRTTKDFPSYPNAVEELLITPLFQHLAIIAEARGYDPETVDTALDEFRAAFEAAPEVATTERRAVHG